MNDRPTPATLPGAGLPHLELLERRLDNRVQDRRQAPPPVTVQPRPNRPTNEPRTNSGLTPDQTIRHIALTHTTHYYRDQDPAPSSDEVIKTATQFANWIKDGA
jgi:hypothetical protein